MLTASGSPLVAGGGVTMQKQPQTLWIEATRAFMRGATVQIGTVLEVPYMDAIGLIATNKAKRAAAPAAVPVAATAPKSQTLHKPQPTAAAKPAATTDGV